MHDFTNLLVPLFEDRITVLGIWIFKSRQNKVHISSATFQEKNNRLSHIDR